MKEDTKKIDKTYKKKKIRLLFLIFVPHLFFSPQAIKETAIQYDTKIINSVQCKVVKLSFKAIFFFKKKKILFNGNREGKYSSLYSLEIYSHLKVTEKETWDTNLKGL